MDAVEKFIFKWLSDLPKFQAWGVWVSFLEQPQAGREIYYDIAANQIKAHPDLSNKYWRGSTSEEREWMTKILAAGLWEKKRRGDTGYDVAEWAKKARARIHDRLANKVQEMPITQKDAENYFAQIARVVARKRVV